MSEVITDLEARKIASEWHGGQASALYSLTSTGAILPDAEGEIDGELRNMYIGNPFGAPELTDSLYALRTYVRHHGERGPVDGWSNLNW